MNLARVVKSEKFTLFIVFAFAFVLRILFLFSLKNDPVFNMPIIDSLEFDRWALDILRGNLLWTTLPNHPPLYAYFLAAIYKIFGYNLPVVTLLQYLLGGLDCILVYFIAKKLTNKAGAVMGSLFMATYWFFIFVQSFLFSENLSLFLNILLMYLLLFLKDNFRKYFICGVVFGLSVICRTDVLLFALFILPWFIIRDIPIKIILRYYLVFIAALILVVGPVILRNYFISKELVMRTQVGASIYIGNNPEFKGASTNLGIGKDWEDFISLPQRTLGRDLKETEADRFFIKETLKIIRQRPGEWIALMGGKIFSLLTGREFLRSEDAYFFNRYIASNLLRVISTRLIFILATAGLILSLASGRRFVLLYAFILSEAFIVFFSLKMRYFMPVVPFLIIFSAYAISRLYESLKNKKLVSALFIVILLCLINILSLFNPLKIASPDISEVYFATAKNYNMRGMRGKAVEYYLYAIELNPRNISAYNDLGVLFLNLKKYDTALVYFEKALSIDINAIKPRLNYQLCRELMSKNKKVK